MRKLRTIIICIVIVALLGVSASVGLDYVKEMNQVEVMVVDVASLASDYYTQDTSLDGYITSSVSQTIYQDSDMIVEEVYVSQGDAVKKGDKLVSFDMTLVEMELNIARLRMQKYEQDLSAAEKRLKSLKNGGPIYESESDSEIGLHFPGYSGGFDETEDDLALADMNQGYYLAVIAPSFFAMFDDGAEAAEDNFGADADNDLFGSGLIDPPAPTATPIPTPIPDVGDGVELFVPDYTNGILDFSDGVEVFYEVLDENSAPIRGAGTKDDPYIFLCSSANEMVLTTGGFLNTMAGYSADGKRIVKEGGYWYQLEFHQDNKVTDYNNRKDSCIGYFLIDGCLLSSPVNMYVEKEFYLSDASQYEVPITPEPIYPGGDSNGGGHTSSISRADAIKSQETIIANMKLDIAELSLSIRKLERKVSKKEVCSKIDGIVAEVEDNDGSAGMGAELMRVVSNQGYYVTGTVSELMLDKMQEGTVLNCMSYETGMFEAVLTDVSEYPTSGNSYWGAGNPNVSYYSFSAEIPDQSVDHSNGEYINITLPADTGDENSLVISKAFVKSENGINYVYKDDHGVLKKQALAVGGNVDSGYSVLITGGLSREDKIAFPYGDSVVEGAKTREGTLDELYGYY